EMITYLGMTAPMALFALISWLRHPYRGNRTQVEVNRLSHREILWLIPLTAAVTVLFYFILAYFETQNLIPSTLSVTTSFVAVYLTFRRSPWFAMAYAANDVVLILLWVLASVSDRSFVSVAVCFIVFLVNDLYGFFRWRIMQKQQREPERGQVHRMD
ncbi:MAG: nicotinamide mononucleotide transporter, partial [Clostridia bacterium]|nr:nicotinamide mononucleotide transporter [Clostridia bacterium]